MRAFPLPTIIAANSNNVPRASDISTETLWVFCSLHVVTTRHPIFKIALFIRLSFHNGKWLLILCPSCPRILQWPVVQGVLTAATASAGSSAIAADLEADHGGCLSVL